MVFWDVLLIFALALILAWVFSGPLGWRRHPGDTSAGALLFLFLILGLVLWATALWVPGVGPVYFGVAWLPLLVVGVLVALLLAAAVPPARRGVSRPPLDSEHASVQLGLGMFVWVLLVALGVVVLLGYFSA